MQTESLGEMLRRKIAHDVQSAQDEARRIAEVEAAKSAYKHKVVSSFFDVAQNQFESAIRQGVLPKRIQVGHGENLDVAEVLSIYSNVQVPDPAHTYHQHWEKFANWAQSNGLKAQWINDYDGGGRDSWYYLTVASV